MISINLTFFVTNLRLNVNLLEKRENKWSDLSSKITPKSALF